MSETKFDFAARQEKWLELPLSATAAGLDPSYAKRSVRPTGN
jgi:hypothetical protein